MDSVAALDEPQESRPLPGGLGLVLGSSGRGLHIIVLSSPLASTPPGMPGTHPPNILVGGTSTGRSPPILLRTFGYSRPILVALRSLSLKPFSFGYKTPPIRFSRAGGQSAHKARPPNLELALTPLVKSVCDGKSCPPSLHVTVSLDPAPPLHCTVAVAIHCWVDLCSGYSRCCSSLVLILVSRHLNTTSAQA